MKGQGRLRHHNRTNQSIFIVFTFYLFALAFPIYLAVLPASRRRLGGVLGGLPILEQPYDLFSLTGSLPGDWI